MMPSLFQSTTIPVLEQVVNFTQARHSLLAGNIANIDTPGYRMRDLSPEIFQARLKDAIRERNETPTSSSANWNYEPNNSVTSVSSSLADMLHHDDSNGNLESQVTAVAKNQLHYNVALAIMTSQFRLLQAAVSEKV